jgi:hypothetical protein
MISLGIMTFCVMTKHNDIQNFDAQYCDTRHISTHQNGNQNDKMFALQHYTTQSNNIRH